MDMELSQLNKIYLSNLVNFNKVLGQRNKLLKELAFNPSEEMISSLDIWDMQFERYGKCIIEGRKKPLFLEVNEGELTIHYGQEENIDVYAKLKPEVMDGIVDGRMTFQRAFMTGEMTAKGNFKILRMLDTMFKFTH